MDHLIKKILVYGLILITFASAGFDSALKKQKFLSPEEAFTVVATAKESIIETKITIAEHIHIYENTLHYRLLSPASVELNIVKPEPKEIDGDKVYEKELVVNIPLQEIESKIAGDYSLEIEF
ncbi:MAG: protein-disulfide reductase DsbD, partial [Pseudomonadota bacterium]